MSDIIVACDLGGTNLSAVACALDGRPLGAAHTRPTMANAPKEGTLSSLREVMSHAIGDVSAEPGHEIVAVGFAAKGPLDCSNGRLMAESLPHLVGFDLAAFIKAEFGLPTFLENNANCLALGEALRGAGIGHEVVVVTNLGTGFGCGIVLGGRIFRGATGNAGELEWCLYDGKKYDDVLSGRGPVVFYQSASGQFNANVSIQDVIQLAASKDAQALAAWDAYGTAVGSVLGTIAAILDPSVIVLAGSGVAQLDLFVASLDRELRKRVAADVAKSLTVERSRLGKLGGLIGAALHAAGCLNRR